MEITTFKDLGISQEILRAIESVGFEEPTPIQRESIPIIKQGRDVLAQSPTGTGKTLAFGIPILEGIKADKDGIQALILCPTRELVLQTSEELKTLSAFMQGIHTVPIYGGQQIERQIFALKKRPQIVIATPGRLMDHMRRRTIDLSRLSAVVLDEADEMLNMGFREDIDVILESVPSEKQMILFSATLSREIMSIAHKYQHDAQMVKITHKELTVPGIEQYYIEARGKAKLTALTLLIEHNRYTRCLVFCNTKRMVDELTQILGARGYRVEALHGDMRQVQRDRVMKLFRNGDVEILVATDVAARGLDVENIEAVFNFDIPSDEEYYVHRIGRTARANQSGIAYTFAAGREIGKLHQIMRYTKSSIHPMKAPTISDITQKKTASLLKTIRRTVDHDNLSEYENRIDEMINDDPTNSLTTLDIAAALLKIISSESSRKLNQRFKVSSTEESVLHKEKSNTSARKKPGRKYSSGRKYQQYSRRS